MLAPDRRELLLDALRPPAGHSLNRAVATTFTLDLEAALTVPLAFAGFRFDEQPDPVEVMEALREMGGRIDIFCQAGAIGAGSWPSDLLALLEGSIHATRRPRPGHIFHPKVWALRFLDRAQEPSYRLLVLSRNLTLVRSWDTVLWLDGRAGRRPRATNAPLARFVAALPGLAVARLPAARAAAVASLAEELRHVDWELPGGAREVRFHPIGLPGARRFSVEEHFGGYRALVISPFVRAGAVRRLLRPGSGPAPVLVSRGEELGALPADALEGLNVYEFDPTASLASDDAEGGSGQGFLTHLHAKLFVSERARLAHLFVGSANATDAGIGQNVEFLCELVGPVSRLGVDALVGEEAPFRAMLTPYVASGAPDPGEAPADARALEDVLLDIAAGLRFRTTVARGPSGWAPRLTADAVPEIPEGVRVTIGPLNRPAESHALAAGEPVEVELPPRELADVTPFLRLTASRTADGAPLERSAVVCSRLDGAPDERVQEILARQIDTPEKLMRLLALLIGFASGRGAETAAGGDGRGAWTAGAGEGVLELLARALAERPESIDHLESIVERLRGSPAGREVLPADWDEVWLPALQARRSLAASEA